MAAGTGSAAGFVEDDQRVFLIDVDTFQVVQQVIGFRAVSQVTFSRDGLSLFVGESRGWTGSRIVEIDIVGRVAFDPVGGPFFVTDNGGGKLVMLRMSSTNR